MLLLQILSDLGTYLHKAIPDTRLTIRKYADAKFEYLSYCLKVKEMDDEEMQFAHLQEPLYRIETGNYEYRYVVIVMTEVVVVVGVMTTGMCNIAVILYGLAPVTLTLPISRVSFRGIP